MKKIVQDTVKIRTKYCETFQVSYLVCQHLKRACKALPLVLSNGNLWCRFTFKVLLRKKLDFSVLSFAIVL